VTETAFQLLDRDHRAISELFDRVSSPDEDRPAVLRELVLRLAGHVAVEHAVVMPELRHSGASDATLEDELTEEHHAIQHHLALIERRKVNSPDMPDLVTETRDLFRAHVQRCQQQLYPDLERCLNGEQMEGLASRLLAADDVVVTRPHPHLLSLGPLSRPMLKIAERLDRKRIGEWGGIFTTPNDNSARDEQTSSSTDSTTDPAPWDSPANDR
jgi:Hemerythrin HHE cation binding domain